VTGLGVPAADVARSEQGKLPAAKAFTLAERDKHMSEQKISFMAQLDQWTEDNVFAPLLSTDVEGNPEELSQETLDQVKQAIRTKVLDSYHNGQAAAPGVKSQPGSFRPRRQFSK
jgi:hypothetical protein